MADDVNVAILGYGIGGRRFHAPLVAATAGMRAAVIVTSDPARVEQARREHPQSQIVSSADSVFDHPANVDVIVISTPNKTHVPLALRAIEAGIPVVIDKPFAPTAAEAQQVVDAAAARGVGLTVFQNRRWDSDFLTVAKLLASHRLGDVVRFESRYDRWVPEIREGWRELGDPQEAGGLLYDLGAHIVDQALTLFGPVARVYAELDRRRPGAQVDDDMFLALTHVSGVRSHLWASTFAAALNPRFRLMGTEATFTKFGLDVQEPQVVGGMTPGAPGWGIESESNAGALVFGDATETVPTEVGCYEQFYAQVRDAVRNGAAFPVDAGDAVAALAVIEAAQRSHAQQQVVEVGAR